MPRIEELDLHGVKHEDVDRLVENFVLLKTLPLRIIIGNSHTMKNLVVDVLQRHNLTYEQFVPSHILVLK
tara:strand:- start:308 stop:517 length:210 start_codon:yes stop_codon:yes gene_type:complete